MEDRENRTDRREYRKKRRVRNQIIAYISLVIVLGGITAGGVYGISVLTKNLSEQKKAKQLAAELEEKTSQQEAVVEPPIVAEPEVVEEVDWLEEMVGTVLSEMPLEDKVAGLFMITPEALTGVDTAVQAGDGTKEALNQYAVGGLVYFKKNIKDKEQISQMLSSTVRMSKYYLFFAVDEEGGDVSRVAEAGIDVEKVGDMAAIGEAGDPNGAFTAGSTIGSYLSELGFNLDFAPVADVVSDPAASAIGKRSFGSDAVAVSEMVSSAVDGLQEAGISACLKHFPGIGASSEDTHEGMAVIEKTLEEMQSSDFLPFKAGIDAGVDMVMVGHVSVPGITGDNTPASMSEKVMTDILRGELGYEGIVVTDAMNMSAITEYYTSEEAAVQALKSGADMILMPDDFEAAYEGVLAAVKDGTLAEERINESLKRIYRVKYKNRVPQPGEEAPAEDTAGAAQDNAADNAQDNAADNAQDNAADNAQDNAVENADT